MRRTYRALFTIQFVGADKSQALRTMDELRETVEHMFVEHMFEVDSMEFTELADIGPTGRLIAIPGDADEDADEDEF